MEKVSENKKKNLSLSKNPITWILVLLIIFMPIATTIITSLINNHFTTSNDWIGFFGSYTGAIIGGLITLFVMNTTIENGNQNLKKTMHQNEIILDKSNRIAFCNDIATVIAKYCGSIKVLIEELIMLTPLIENIKICEYECINLEDKLQNANEKVLKKVRLEESIEDTEKKLQLANQKLVNSKKEFENAKNNLPKLDTFTILFLLEIKLKNIEDAKELLKKANQLNQDIEEYMYVKDNLFDIADLNFKIKNILDEANKFINKYLEY